MHIWWLEFCELCSFVILRAEIVEIFFVYAGRTLYFSLFMQEPHLYHMKHLIWSIWFQKQLCTKDLGLTGFRGGSRWWVLCWCDSHSTMMWTSVSGWELSSIKLCHCYAFVLFLHWRLSWPTSGWQSISCLCFPKALPPLITFVCFAPSTLP